MVVQKIYRASTKSLIEELIKDSPEDIIVKALPFLGNIFNGLKEPLLNEYASGYSPKEKELIWQQLTDYYNDLLFPLISATDRINKAKEQNQQNLSNYVFRSNFGQYAPNSLWEKKPSIQVFNTIKIPDDVAKITCKIGSKYYKAIPDTGSNESIYSHDIIEEQGIPINTKNKETIEVLKNMVRTLGTSYDIPVTISNDQKSITILSNPSIIEAEVDRYGKYISVIILGNPDLYKLGWKPITDRVFEVSKDGISFSIPLSVHKATREVFTIQKEPSFGNINNTELKKN